MTVSAILFALSFIFLIIWLWCKYNYSYWERKGIPFVNPLPIIGNTSVVFSMKTSFGLYLSDIYNDKQLQSASAVGIYILHKPALVIREAEVVKSILIKEFNKFSNRYSRSDPHRDILGANNLFFVRNPYWRDIRQKLTPVFTSGKIKQMYPLMLEIAEDLENHLKKYKKTENAFVVEIKEICALFTTDMIATIAFGVRANSLENPTGEFREQGRKMFYFTLSRAFDFFIAFFLPNCTSLFRVKVMTNEFTAFLRKTINYVISERERNGNTRNDLIDTLVNLKKEAATMTNTNYFAKNNDFLVAQGAVFFTAGFETSSSTMAFSLYELAKRTDLQDRLRSEICDALVLEDGKISYENINSLEYLSMVVDEVLRLYPVLPFLDREYQVDKNDEHFSLKPYYDCKLENGTPIFIPIYGIQRDPKYWPNPNTFDPERFSNENKKKHHPMSYLPFGTGPHNCIGNRIGLLQAKIGLISILKNHRVEICEKTVRDMKFDSKAFILQCDGGIYLKLVNDNLFDIATNKI